MFNAIQSEEFLTRVQYSTMATIPSRVQDQMTAVENVNLSVWNVLAASKQRSEGETIRRTYRRYHCVSRTSSANDRSCGPTFNRFASRAEAAIVTARQCRLVDPGWPSIIFNSSSQSTAESWACSGPCNSFTALMNAENSRSARRIPNTIVQLFSARTSVVMQAEIQSDLLYDYRTNMDSYPKWQT
jgi:hypothetical protein